MPNFQMDQEKEKGSYTILWLWGLKLFKWEIQTEGTVFEGISKSSYKTALKKVYLATKNFEIHAYEYKKVYGKCTLLKKSASISKVFVAK